MDLNNPCLPNDPLRFIQACVRKRLILWTYHVNIRLRERFIPRQIILDAVENYEIIETYADDKYLPSYLVLAKAGRDAFHTLFAVDVKGYNVRVVTAYWPSLGEWKDDLKTRRTSR